MSFTVQYRLPSIKTSCLRSVLIPGLRTNYVWLVKAMFFQYVNLVNIFSMVNVQTTNNIYPVVKTNHCIIRSDYVTHNNVNME